MSKTFTKIVNSLIGKRRFTILDVFFDMFHFHQTDKYILHYCIYCKREVYIFQKTADYYLRINCTKCNHSGAMLRIKTVLKKDIPENAEIIKYGGTSWNISTV